ncbi:SDR family oxidoreductase [Pararhizobium sp.]|uniref:SDR family oxidoreductase n=1 Tax=Pararhizobium sp. TaxID=1977563 RepID=UPI002723BAF3|nr:aldehyde reductase [Pararhizobium sp.]MDO9417510.1 aldehyde reductase [Pararhizobium sp.]
MTDKTILVTGISGFIAKHCAIEFLRAGYQVRGTLRSLSKAESLTKVLAGYADVSRLSLVEADLLSDRGWDAAMQGMRFVAHVASPFPLRQPKDENDLIRPAVDGTLRVLKAAVSAGVEHLVQTSSTAAIGYGHGSHPAPFSNQDWTVVDGPGVSAYSKSKTLAERAARDFIASSQTTMRFASVNPGLVAGPLTDPDFGSSAEVIQMMMLGKYPALPRVKMAIVDVRDVAKMHRLALEADAPSGGRYLAVAGTMWFAEIARTLKAGLGKDARKVPQIQLPDFVVRLAALFDRSLADVVPMLGEDATYDTSPSRDVLGMTFVPAGEAIVAMGASLKRMGRV